MSATTAELSFTEMLGAGVKLWGLALPSPRWQIPKLIDLTIETPT
jgi:hypothetical protein